MLRRLAFLVCFILGGFVFFIPYWLVRGSKGSRDRKKIIRQQDTIMRKMEGQGGS